MAIPVGAVQNQINWQQAQSVQQQGVPSQGVPVLQMPPQAVGDTVSFSGQEQPQEKEGGLGIVGKTVAVGTGIVGLAIAAKKGWLGKTAKGWINSGLGAAKDLATSAWNGIKGGVGGGAPKTTELAVVPPKA